MYRSLFYRLLPIRQIKKECLLKVVDWSPEPIAQKWSRHLTTSAVCYKKRKSVEERAVENTGRKVIRYSPKAGTEVVGIWRNMTVSDLAGVLKKDVEHVYKALEFADKTSNIDYREDTVLHNPQVVRDVVKISGCRFKIVPRPDQDLQEEENKDAVPAPPAPEHALRPRPPVACVMGHVDHGKTTLLDALRDTAVVDQEFGGITQHIGAFQVRISSGDTVTFLDTPGHAAFSAMRARGAGVTDLVVLVVAADDGVMDQTTESIRMARQADVPILVAVNKMDKPGANIDKVLRSLSTVGVVCEALGGDVQAVPVSALRRTGLDHLIDALVLQAQLMDLKADPTGYVEGVVIEAQLDTRTGKQATVLVQRGTLRRGCVLVAGGGWAKVRVLQSADGTSVAEAGPGTPVAVLGWRDLPAAGDLALEVASEKRAGEVMRWRRAARMRDKQAGDEGAIAAKEAQHQAAYKEQVAKRRAAGRFRMRREGPREKMIRDDGHPTLSVLIKGDVDGSVEALVELLDTYEDHDRVRLTLVHAGVGPPTPSDVEMAEAFKAIIYTFNVETPPAVAAEAKTRAVPVKQHNVIYRLIDDVKQEISSRIPVTQEELILGEANVLQQFQVSEGRKKVPVAGCRCVRGSLRRERYRLLRAGELLYDGKLASMKHLKEEVTSIKRDMECGLRLEDPSVEVRPGDTLVCYTLVDKRPDTDWDPGF